MQIETISNLRTEVSLKEKERQRIAADTEHFLRFGRNQITRIAPSASAHDQAESKTTQQRDEISFKRAAAIKSEREAADKARKIRSLATVIRRHKKRSAEA